MDTVDLLFNAQRPSMNQAAPRCSPARCQRNRHRMVLHRLRCAVRRCLATGPAQKVSTVCDRSAGPQECGRTCLKTAVTGSTSGTRAPVLKAVPQRPVRSLEPTWSAILEFGQFLNDFLDRSDLCLAVFSGGCVAQSLQATLCPQARTFSLCPAFPHGPVTWSAAKQCKRCTCYAPTCWWPHSTSWSRVCLSSRRASFAPRSSAILPRPRCTSILPSGLSFSCPIWIRLWVNHSIGKEPFTSLKCMTGPATSLRGEMTWTYQTCPRVP